MPGKLGEPRRPEDSGYGIIECAGWGTRVLRFGRTVVDRPSILWWLSIFRVLRGYPRSIKGYS